MKMFLDILGNEKYWLYFDIAALILIVIGFALGKMSIWLLVAYIVLTVFQLLLIKKKEH